MADDLVQARLGAEPPDIAGARGWCRALPAAAAIAHACPNGVDVFYDNVGGPTLDAAIANLQNDTGRI